MTPPQNMTVFENKPETWQRLDWSILRNGWVSFYNSSDSLVENLDWLRGENYSIVEFDCTSWLDENEMHAQLRDKLNFLSYYGQNFDALNDCLSDIEILGAGLVLVFRHIDTYNKSKAQILLDIIADNARRHMLFGNRLMALIQADNLDYEIEAVGATPIIKQRTEG